ncbi:cyclic nucleotide-gated ion channel 1 [Citrus sinensis]|uniref:Cyclic nucleotide-gated ion channel 1 n=2 Tax=Citrus sinensis TaxID=2711 RepID=A0ACB8HR10_CITSI|nr:cyclic nucleotide-gated ion channel 1 [Citrus sinensis]
MFGSLWYFFAVQRKAECWKKACTDFTRCDFLPLHCDDSLTNYTFFSDFCSTKTQNATIYDFGIFRDAIQSGVLDQNYFFRRSRDLNLEEGTPRRVASVEMDCISWSAREAAKSVYRTLNESLGNGGKTCLQQIRDLPIRFLEVNFLLIYVYSMVFDPVFLYLPVINDDKKCFQFDIWALRVGIVERTGCDIYFLINNAFQLWENWHRNYSISLLPVFLFDLSIILPLPQVLVLLVYSNVMSGKKFFSVMNLFIVQHLLKVIRLYALIKERKNSYKQTKWARLTFNLFYLHAANGFGALWYFFALQRKTECWRKACTDSAKCRLLPLHCDNSLTNYTFSNDFCSTKTQIATTYHFGIFYDAINSSVIEQNNLFLSSFGQGLPFSTNVLENIFVISITITGVVLFFFLIGKVQSEMSKAEEIRQKVQEIYKWRPVEKLPEKLQMEIKEHQLSKVQETTGIDVEYLVNNLPEDLRKNIKQKLCLDLLKKVEEFGNLDGSSLEKLCDVVKPAVFTERSYIIQEENPIDQMLFVLQGKLWTYTSRRVTELSSNSGNLNNHLEGGDFSGEELIAWAKAGHNSSNLPISTKTIQALTKVEAFVLMAYDLKQFGWQYGPSLFQQNVSFRNYAYTKGPLSHVSDHPSSPLSRVMAAPHGTPTATLWANMGHRVSLNSSGKSATVEIL